MSTEFERALRCETVMLHRDQHKEVARVTRMWPNWGSTWCWVCGFTIRGVPQKVRRGTKVDDDLIGTLVANPPIRFSSVYGHKKHALARIGTSSLAIVLALAYVAVVALLIFGR